MSLSHAQDSKKAPQDAYNPLAVARYLPSSPAMAELLRRTNALLSTVSGLDRVMALVQYSSPLVGFLLQRSIALSGLVPGNGRLIKPAGTRRLGFAAGLQILAGKLSDARMLMRFAGLPAMISWLLSLEQDATAPKDRKLRNINRLQAWSMLAYYPLEHIYYFAAHNVITLAPSKKLQAILWACRAWAVYVFLNLLAYSEQARALSAKMAVIAEKRRKAEAGYSLGLQSNMQAEKINTDDLVDEAENALSEASLIMNEQECIQQSRKLINGVTTDLAYAPLTIHWSLANGLFRNNVPLWESTFGTIAILSSLRAAWRATAR